MNARHAAVVAAFAMAYTRILPVFATDMLHAGVRAYDIGDPFQPREVAYFVPGAPARAPSGAIQLNDVYVDERRIVYTVDRFVGGLYILELTL